MSDVKIINDPVFGFIKIPKGMLYGIVEHPLVTEAKPHQSAGVGLCGVSWGKAHAIPALAGCIPPDERGNTEPAAEG